MKKISLLVLVVMLLAVALTACGNNEPPVVDTHVHNYSDEWCVNDTHHWLAATCEGHSSEKVAEYPHRDADDNGMCDVCDYYIYYTITVNAPANVTVAGDLSTKNSADVTFTATVSENYVVKANGASQVGDAVVDNGVATYTFKVAGVDNENVVVTLTTERVGYVTVVAEGTGSVENVISWETTYTTVTVNVPAAGNYSIYATAGADGPNLYFGQNGVYSNEDDYYDNVYEFTATEAGEITLDLKFMSYSDLELLEFGYFLLGDTETEVVLPSLSGSDIKIPTNMLVTLQLVVPTPGFYYFTADLEDATWNDTIASGVYISTTAENQTVSVDVKVSDIYSASVELVWSCAAPVPTVIDGTSANVTLVNGGDYAAISYTATDAGTYVFTAGEAQTYFYYWNAEYSTMSGTYENSYTVDIAAGETVLFFVAYNNYAGDPETIDDVITAGLAPNFIGPDSSTAIASPEGAENVLVNDSWDEILYSIVAPEGVQLCVKGEDNWVTELELTVGGGEQVVILVKSETETEVVLTIEEVVYEASIYEGMPNSVTLLPGVEYTFNVMTNVAPGQEFVLTWDNADVVFYYNSEPLVSGNSYFWWPNYGLELIAVNNSGADVTFNVQFAGATSAGGEEDSDGLVLGTNSVNVTVQNYYCAGTDVTFTATEAGTYYLSASEAGEMNASIYNITADEFIENEPYFFTLEAGESVTFNVATSAYMTLTEDTIDFVIGMI